MTKPEPSTFEINAFNALSTAKQLILVPVTFNGQKRFALFISLEGTAIENKPSLIQLVGILPQEGDVVTPIPAEQEQPKKESLN